MTNAHLFTVGVHFINVRRCVGFPRACSQLSVLWPVGAFMTMHLVCENAVIPAVLGRRFGINPFLVFVSIIFWMWMWGAIGAVLAVPLLLIARTIRSEFWAETRPPLPS